MCNDELISGGLLYILYFKCAVGMDGYKIQQKNIFPLLIHLSVQFKGTRKQHNLTDQNWGKCTFWFTIYWLTGPSSINIHTELYVLHKSAKELWICKILPMWSSYWPAAHNLTFLLKILPCPAYYSSVLWKGKSIGFKPLSSHQWQRLNVLIVYILCNIKQ